MSRSVRSSVCYQVREHEILTTSAPILLYMDNEEDNNLCAMAEVELCVSVSCGNL